MSADQLAQSSASITLRTTSGMVLFSSTERVAPAGMKCITHNTAPAKPLVRRSMTQNLIATVDQQVCLRLGLSIFMRVAGVVLQNMSN